MQVAWWQDLEVKWLNPPCSNTPKFIISSWLYHVNPCYTLTLYPHHCFPCSFKKNTYVDIEKERVPLALLLLSSLTHGSPFPTLVAASANYFLGAEQYKKLIIFASLMNGNWGGGFSNSGTPIAGWFIVDNPPKWMIWGYLHFRKLSFVSWCKYRPWQRPSQICLAHAALPRSNPQSHPQNLLVL